MKRILCFGDSLTYGYMPCEALNSAGSNRFPEEVRWTGVMAKELGGEYIILEEGLNGRKTIYDAEDGPIKNAMHYLAPCLMSASPVDLVIVMLGSNDLKLANGVTEATLGCGIRELIRVILANPECGRGDTVPKILVAAPPPLCRPDHFMVSYEKRGGELGVQLSKLFAPVYEAVAAEMGCAFIDCGLYGEPSRIDGLHMDAASHSRLGKAMAEKVRELV